MIFGPYTAETAQQVSRALTAAGISHEQSLDEDLNRKSRQDYSQKDLAGASRHGHVYDARYFYIVIPDSYDGKLPADLEKFAIYNSSTVPSEQDFHVENDPNWRKIMATRKRAEKRQTYLMQILFSLLVAFLAYQCIAERKFY